MFYNTQNNPQFCCRQVPINQYNIITVLFSYFIEVCNIFILFLSLPILYVLVVGHLVFVAGQLTFLTIWCTSNTVCLLSIAISVFKILLITRFSLIFPLDPEVVGRKVLALSSILGSLPSLVITIYQTINGVSSMHLVAYFTGEQLSRTVNPLPFFIVTTVLFTVALIMLPVTMLITSHFIQNHNSSLSTEIAEQQFKLTISLKRLLLGLVLFLIPAAMTTSRVIGSPGGGLSCQIILTPFFVNLMFTFFVFDGCVWDFIKRALRQKFQFIHRHYERKICPI